MKNNFLAFAMFYTSLKCEYKNVNGDVAGEKPAKFFDKLEECWKVIRQDTIVNDTAPLSQATIATYLLSDTNRNASDSRIVVSGEGLNQGDGKRYALRRKFYPKQYQGNLANHAIQYCKVSGAESGEVVAPNITIRYEHNSEQILLDKKRILCKDESWQEYVSKRLSEQIRIFEKNLLHKISAHVATGLNHDGDSYVGAFVGPGSGRGQVLRWPVMKADGETINTTGLAWFHEVMESMELAGRPPVLFGNHYMSILSKKLGYENCSTCSGVDAASVKQDVDAMFIRDNEIGKRFNPSQPNTIIAMVPGALKVVTRTNNKGDFMEEGENEMRSTIILPRLGLEADIYWNRQCGKTYSYSYQLGIEWDVIGYPKCWNNDPCFKDVTDVMAFLPVCEDIDMCNLPEIPQCAVLPAPVQAHGETCTDELLFSCPVQCSVSGTSTLEDKCFHEFKGAIRGNVSNYGFNDVAMPLGSTYDDLSDADQFNAFVADLTDRLPGGGKVVFAEYTALGELNILLDLPCSVAVFDLRDGNAVVADFAKTSKQVVCYTANATPTTGGVITGITWVMPDGTPITGAPGMIINIPGYYGTVESFCVDIELAGDAKSEVPLIVTDSKACQKEVRLINFDCVEGDAPIVTDGGNGAGSAGKCDYTLTLSGTVTLVQVRTGDDISSPFSTYLGQQGAEQIVNDLIATVIADQGMNVDSYNYDLSSNTITINGSDTPWILIDIKGGTQEYFVSSCD